ncbi:2-amino-4-hydroxy-6-hydroxymethyldihydropteridinediphosphokinase [Pseudoxanthomonas sp. GM95]|uniref:2-amino-4-hydroxy-6- hydroxymethyldihydropteridine diphosphokinase n=1 Tax=Pseudoxanthomonas sp. GM95 TaxID=1881043 RepID=UPI0008B73D4F|nr:2-amino-4-hydroxy-6-hydroxymethyldihydropteridine diphosphokinase [Pseudoxanthomonas sp. GM95]SEM38676.1 2-amino-4-hydroxy-6-hydroxymethyldihydropteridinediphosphokinase [Pseudoxanthomonas sp. GM95]
MKTRRYVLLLGSSLDSPQVLRLAIETLSAQGLVEATSRCVEGPSVSGDARRFHNQAIVFASGLANDALVVSLKKIETELGRVPGDAQCVIDIDLACECDAHGIVLWRDDTKLGHPLFVGLMQDVLNQLRGPTLA